MNANTTYYVQIVPKNSEGLATGCNDIWWVKQAFHFRKAKPSPLVQLLKFKLQSNSTYFTCRQMVVPLQMALVVPYNMYTEVWV